MAGKAVASQSAEVKQYTLNMKAIHQPEGFSNETGRRGGFGVVVALEFEEGVRDALEGLGLISLNLEDMLRIVELWDPIKQRTAVTSFLYYAKHIEKNFSLSARLDKFLEAAAADWLAERAGDASPPA
jgi:hypothetical protein